jgi:hypothetical protein
MAFTKLYRPILRGIALLFSIVWLLFMMLHNEVPVDVGDGVTHYFISAASWKDSILFLHHWGKPFFIRKRNKGLWTRLYVENNGDEAKTKIAYLKHRAEQLQEVNGKFK